MSTTMRSSRPFANRFGQRLRARREAIGLTQTQLARKLPGGKMDGGQISRWERGESFPTYANVVALARAFKVSEEALLLGVDDVPALKRVASSKRA